MPRHHLCCWAAHAVGVLLLAIGVGCRPAAQAERAAGVWYRAAVTTDGGDEIPFFLELPENCNTGSATLANGQERIPVACSRVGSRVLLDFPVYGTRIAAELDPGGALSGFWDRGGLQAHQRLAFKAMPLDALDQHRRFAPGAPSTSALNVSGIWRMTFDTYGPAKGVFEQDASGVVRGTIDVPSDYGDFRFLAGEIEGTDALLSTFDGGHASLLRARVDGRGRLVGEFINTDGPRDSFAAERSDDFEIVDPLQQVRVISTERRLDFAPLSSPRYSGKPVILEVFGTWCPNCNDLAPLLTDLYETHHREGLEMLGVAYELSDDASHNRDRLAAYRAKYRMDWEVVAASDVPGDLFSGPARLSSIEGVPLTIFLNRDRTIHAIYAGFRGPATGATHDQTTETFRRLTREILQSQ
jgi:thiol-disulfide isomerase/thioredoxin